MLRTILFLGTSLTFLTIFAAGTAFAADVEKGKKVFRKCKACHELADTGKKKTGPNLENIVGRRAGSVDGFKYSKNLLAAGEDGLTWTEETLDRFLSDARAFVPRTRMSFAGLKRDDERANLIAYLASLSDAETAAAEAAANGDPEVAPEILAIEGDVAYGEYLASGCVTCHQADGSDKGLPSIVGWPTEGFVTVMHAYKSKHRENPVMQQQAGALSNEEIAALAAFFNGLGQ